MGSARFHPSVLLHWICDYDERWYVTGAEQEPCSGSALSLWDGGPVTHILSYAGDYTFFLAR
ncbi:MAG: hypothetical protein IJW40_10325 [Clostridia bacterium]|nr:hypothetical protein [Clostridia bacterium]